MYSFLYTQLTVKTVIFQTIKSSISTQFSSIWSIHMALSGATTQVHSGPVRDVMKGYSVLLKAPA